MVQRRIVARQHNYDDQSEVVVLRGDVAFGGADRIGENEVRML